MKKRAVRTQERLRTVSAKLRPTVLPCFAISSGANGLVRNKVRFLRPGCKTSKHASHFPHAADQVRRIGSRLHLVLLENIEKLYEYVTCIVLHISQRAIILQVYEPCTLCVQNVQTSDAERRITKIYSQTNTNLLRLSIQEQIDSSEVKVPLTLSEFLVHPVCKMTTDCFSRNTIQANAASSMAHERRDCTPQTPSLVCYNAMTK